MSLYRNDENCVFLSCEITIHIMYPYSILMREREESHSDVCVNYTFKMNDVSRKY